MNPLYIRTHGYDMDNHHQKVEALGLFFQAAAKGCDGSLGVAFMLAERPHQWIPELDGRTAEMRAMKEAETKLYEALATYDRCRRECRAKAAKTK